MALGVPAGATPDKSPVVQQLTSVTCANGFLDDDVVWVGGRSVAGHFLDENGPTYPAKSVYVFETESDAAAGTDAIDVAFDRPGKGLDKNTTWCWWQLEGGPPVWFGGDIMDAAN